jgi:hypothetical protein
MFISKQRLVRQALLRKFEENQRVLKKILWIYWLQIPVILHIDEEIQHYE